MAKQKLTAIAAALCLLLNITPFAFCKGIVNDAKAEIERRFESVRDEIKMNQAVIEARRMHWEDAQAILNTIEPSSQNTALYVFCDTWEETVQNLDFNVKGSEISFWAKDGYGTLFELEDNLCFIPDNINENTKYMVYFPGGNDVWTIRHDLVEEYLDKYEPNAICVFFKESFVNDIPRGQFRTELMLQGLCKETGIAPQKIAILASSNGGYEALWTAAYLFDACQIMTDKIVILDMGMAWEKPALIDENSAISLVESGVVVYHFGRGHEINRNYGSVKFKNYGVPMVNVMCQHGGHDDISKYAFLNGTFSWAIGEQPDLDNNEYTIEYLT